MHRKLLIPSLILLVIALPLLVKGTAYAFLIRIIGIMGLYMILALGLNLVIGHLGLLDLGFMAFYAIGAYTAALLSLQGWSFWIILPASILVTVGVRLLLGAPVLRLRGDYLAIVTLGFGEITRIILNNWDSVTNGPKGINLLASPNMVSIRFLFLEIRQDLHFYYLIAVFVVIGVLMSTRLENSRIGRAWVAIREDEMAAEHMGMAVTRLKMLAFGFSAAYAACAGTIFVRWERFVTPESFTFWESALLVVMVVIGGMGSIPGVLLGVVLVVGIPEALRSVLEAVNLINTRYLLFGMALVLVAIYRPQGILPSKRREMELRTGSEDGS